jgi:hypothetical protein
MFFFFFFLRVSFSNMMKNSKHVRKRRVIDFVVYNVSRLTCDLEWEFYRYVRFAYMWRVQISMSMLVIIVVKLIYMNLLTHVNHQIIR